jgi:formate dehydrogenase subunit gamma
MNATGTWDAERAALRIAELQDMPGALIPILHALQEEFGYIDREVIPVVAEAVNLSRAEVVGVINFYHDFRQEPPGRHLLQVCRAEACQSMGCEALVDHLKTRLGVDMGETTADGKVTLKAVYCLGNCALAPAVMLDGNLHGRVSTAWADYLLGEAGL